MATNSNIEWTAHRLRDPDGDHSSNDWCVLVERDDQETDGRR